MTLECAECGKRYRCKEALNRHRNNHTGVKRYICESCQVSFSRHDVLSIHLTRVHGKTFNRETATESHRQRCFKACNNCRKSKSKCDGNLTCSACADGGLACIYDNKSRRIFQQDNTPPVSGDRSPQTLIESLSLPDIDGFQKIWSDNGDWSWVFDDSYFVSATLLAAAQPLSSPGLPRVELTEHLSVPTVLSDEENLLDELINHAMIRYTSPN
jgi:hypothetical protein